MLMPSTDKRSSTTLVEWPKRLPGYSWMPAYWGRHSPPFLAPPTLVVLHSGSRAANVAGYLARPGDGRMVSAHFAWLPGQDCYVQMVDLDRVAWHAGKAINATAIGIELSGPWHQDPRSAVELDRLSHLLADLVDAMPSLTYWVRHSELNAGKSDPGPGLPDELPTKAGLVHV